MDAIIGKYKVRIEETVGPMEFIKVHQAAIASVQRDAEPGIGRVVVGKESRV